MNITEILNIACIMKYGSFHFPIGSSTSVGDQLVVTVTNFIRLVELGGICTKSSSNQLVVYAVGISRSIQKYMAKSKLKVKFLYVML